jgi:predicted amidophosphoribosyltransferase
MTKSDRKKNIAEAFTASAQIVEKRVVLLVDDVTTSGATMETCSKALIQAGALAVYGLTLARSVFDPSV